jgi:hypothetical protein
MTIRLAAALRAHRHLRGERASSGVDGSGDGKDRVLARFFAGF